MSRSLFASADKRLKSADDFLITRYKLWRRFTPLLYDVACTRVIDWPAVTIEWLAPTGDFAAHGTAPTDTLLLLAHYSSSKEDSLNVMRFVEASDSIGDAASAKVVARIPLEASPSIARSMPQRCSLVASRSASGVQLNDFEAATQPARKLSATLTEGASLAWSGASAGRLVAGTSSGQVVYWDVDHSATPVETRRALDADVSPVTAVEFSPDSASTFAYATEAGTLALVDVRAASAALTMRAPQAVHCVAHDPTQPSRMLSGDSRNDVALWDWKSPSSPLCVFRDPFAHMKRFPFPKEVTRLRWCPDRASMFAAASGDATVRLWDVARSHCVQSTAEALDGPPELLFLHGGHTDEVVDVSWSPQSRMTLASVAEDNIFMVWRPLDKVLE